MEQRIDFRALIRDPRVRDRQDLRRAAHVMDMVGITPHELMAAEPEQVAAWLTSCGCTTARQVANRLPRVLNGLAAIFPEESLPVTEERTRLRHRLCALEDEPRRLQEDIEAVRAEQAGRAGNDELLALIGTPTHEGYIRSMRELFAALKRAGMPVSDATGVNVICDPKRFAIGLDRLLSEGFAKGTVYKVGLATIAIASDLFGEDDAVVQQLRAEMVGRAPGHQIGAERCLKLIEMLVVDGAQRIVDAPRMIAERADSARSVPEGRRSRRAAALAWDLKLNHPGLAPCEVPRIHLDHSFEHGSEGWAFRYRPHRSSEKVVKEPMAASSVRFRAEFESHHGAANRLLFPSRRGVERHFNPILMFMYREFEFVTGIHLDFMVLKDMSAAAGLLGEERDTLLETSQGLRYQHSVSFVTRLRTLITYVNDLKKTGFGPESQS